MLKDEQNGVGEENTEEKKTEEANQRAAKNQAS